MTLAPDNAVLRKARGAFFTPSSVARYIARWAVRSAADQVLEPSCGEAAFLHAAAEQLATYADTQGVQNLDYVLDGVEIHAASAAAARESLSAADANATIKEANFFSLHPTGSYDAVIGNPPYVRYQDFSGEARAESKRAALRAGVSLSSLASSWAAFTVHSALFLRPGGRMGLVLPAELLTVNYAAEVRRFLMDRFATVRLVIFVERVFPGVQEEVVLLLAEDYDPTGEAGTDHCELVQTQNGDTLEEAASGTRKWKPATRASKWTPSMMAVDALAAYLAVTGDESFDLLEGWGDTTLGMVTGNNRYFALSPQRVAELGLRPSDLIPISPPGSTHLRGVTLSAAAWHHLGESGAPAWLFRPEEPSDAAVEYIAAGEATGVNLAYKCRVRKPWWRVPLVKPPDLFLTYMNADTPRLCANRAGVHHLNSVHGVYLPRPVRRLGLDYLALASLNSVTLLGAEVVGRAYGGGMLKLEPKEADQLPVPSIRLIRSAATRLSEARRSVVAHCRVGRLQAAVDVIDEILLVDGAGMSRNDVARLRTTHRELRARRIARGKESANNG